MLNGMEILEVPLAGIPQVLRCNHLVVQPEYFRGSFFQYEAHHTLHFFQYAAAFHFGKRLIQVRPGDWLLCPANLRYGHADKAFQHGAVIYFHFTYPEVRGKSFRLPLHGNLGPHFREVWHECLSIVADGRSKDEGLRQSAGTGLHRILLRIEALGRLGLFSDTPAGAGTRADLAVQDAAEFLKSYLTEPLPLGVMAQRFSLSRDYLTKCFKKRYGLTLAQFRLKCQMEEAFYLMQKSTLSFSAIARTCGFHDPQHFNKRVKKYFKKTPSEIRGE